MFQIRENDEELNNSFELETKRISLGKKPKSLDDFEENNEQKQVNNSSGMITIEKQKKEIFSVTKEMVDQTP